ncbi:MAG: hypothetical protein ACHQ53_05535 [Polyangiales bacterium]
MRSARLRALALCVVLAAAAAPGLLGSWVYDDQMMLSNPAYEGLGALLRVPRQDSNAYAPKRYGGPAPDATYRPTTMLTLVATHVLSPHALAHHLVGLALHLLVAWLLFLALCVRTPRTAALVAAAFMLHPAGVEAWVWINGRSDLVAGAVLAALAALLSSDRRPLLAIATLGLLGAGAKEPFFIAATALTVSYAFDSRAAVARRRSAWTETAVLGVGMAALWLARAALVPTRVAFAAGGNALTDVGLLGTLGKELLTAADHLLLLRSEPMLALASLTVRGPTIAEVAAGALALLGIGLLVRARDLRALALVGGAVATLAPTVVLSRALWLGFDRYLYMPAILLALTVGPYLERASERLDHMRWPGLASRALLGVEALVLFTAASSYRSDATFHRAMLLSRPNDASLYAYEALSAARMRNPELAHALLDAFPKPPWPEAVIVPLITTSRALGDPVWLERAISYGEARFPGSALVRAHAMVWHFEHGDDPAALRLAASFSSKDVTCAEVARQVAVWARKAPEPRRVAWVAAAQQVRCR